MELSSGENIGVAELFRWLWACVAMAESGSRFFGYVGASAKVLPVPFFFAAMWCVGRNHGWAPELLVERTLRSVGVSQ